VPATERRGGVEEEEEEEEEDKEEKGEGEDVICMLVCFLNTGE
jgi:hypothetical protein